MHIESIVWDGASLSAIIAIENRRVTCTIPRDAVNAVPLYGDAISWEIDRHKIDIFERVKSLLERKIKEHSQESIYLRLDAADLAAA